MLSSLSSNLFNPRGYRARSVFAPAWLAASLALLLSSCSSFDLDGSSSLMRQLEPAAVSGAAVEASPEHKKLVAMFGGQYRAPAAEALLNGLLARLAQADILHTLPLFAAPDAGG